MDPRQGEYSSLAPPADEDALPKVPKVIRKNKRATYAALLSTGSGPGGGTGDADDYVPRPSRPKSFVIGKRGDSYQKLSDEYDGGERSGGALGETNQWTEAFRRRSGRHVSRDIADRDDDSEAGAPTAHGVYEGEGYPYPFETPSSPQKVAAKDGGYGRSQAVAEEYKSNLSMKHESVATGNSDMPFFKSRNLPPDPYEPVNVQSHLPAGDQGNGGEKDPWYLGHKFVINFSTIFSACLLAGSIGNCGKVQHAGTTIQLGAHILATIFLCLTIYTSTVLLSPTRSEISRAHSRHKWLSVGGVLSFRNIFQTHLLRSIPAVLLLISGLCIAILWPIAISIPTVSGSTYNWALAGSNFFDQGAWAKDTFTHTTEHWNDTTKSVWKGTEEVKVFTNPSNTLEIMQSEGKNWTKLAPETCVTTYGVPYLSGFKDVILLAGETDPTNAFIKGGMIREGDEGMGSWEWLCGLDGSHPASHCNVNVLSSVLRLRANWTLGTGQYHIKYCMAQPERNGEGKCAIGFNIALLWSTIGLFATSTVCFAIASVMARSHRRKFKNRLLVTIGNVIDSFLQETENATKGMCLVDKKGFKWGRDWRGENCKPVIYEKMESRRMWGIVGLTKTLLMLAMCAGLLGASGVGLNNMLKIDQQNGYPINFQSLFRRRFPKIITLNSLAPTYSSLATSPSPSFYLLLLSAAPQVLLTIFFLSTHHLLSYIYIRREWTSFSVTHQPLRTTSLPRGAQIWSWYITIPLPIQIPIIFFFSVMAYTSHVSFLYVHISSKEQLNSGIAHNAVGILYTIMILALWTLFLLYHILQQDIASIPVVQNCSAGVSAACHPSSPSSWAAGTKEDEDIASYEVMWGVVPNKRRDRTSEYTCLGEKEGNDFFEKEKELEWGGDLAHASFTNAGIVGYLKEGVGYA